MVGDGMGEENFLRGWDYVLDVCVHLALFHQLDAFIEASAHLCELLFHLLDLGVGCNFLSRCDL